MKRFLERIWPVLDRGIDVLLWLQHAVFLYVLVVWLMPLLAMIGFSMLFFDLKPYLRAAITEDALVFYGLAGLPFWTTACLYATFGQSVLAARLRMIWERGPVVTGTALLVFGGLLYLMGAF